MAVLLRSMGIASERKEHTLTLDTSDPKYRLLRPQNPEVSFSVLDSDELYTFDPKFHEERAIVKRAAVVGPHVPKRIN